ncbi:hypothetical protein [Lysobacter arvi]|uniref:Transposase n=1 Tax=Lysobacter arvi TaxID=3038776 RepID=A0ABU1CCE4_9GAMM|nr:hypothetical protein [Lysobacter arvi]MDR0182828.1 hypothetical protein [Lysobacter arvi]
MFGFAEVKREPAFAGMTSKSRATANGKVEMDSSFRWNDGEAVHQNKSARTIRTWVAAFIGIAGVRDESARTLRAWVPAFAGMTVTRMA